MNACTALSSVHASRPEAALPRCAAVSSHGCPPRSSRAQRGSRRCTGELGTARGHLFSYPGRPPWWSGGYPARARVCRRWPVQDGQPGGVVQRPKAPAMRSARVLGRSNGAEKAAPPVVAMGRIGRPVTGAPAAPGVAEVGRGGVPAHRLRPVSRSRHRPAHCDPGRGPFAAVAGDQRCAVGLAGAECPPSRAAGPGRPHPHERARQLVGGTGPPAPQTVSDPRPDRTPHRAPASLGQLSVRARGVRRRILRGRRPGQAHSCCAAGRARRSGAYSRVYTGANYPSDVLAGTALGVSVAAAANRLAPTRTPDPVRVVEPRPDPRPPRPHGDGVVVVINPKSGGGRGAGLAEEGGRLLPRAEVVTLSPGDDLVQTLRRAAQRAEVLAVGGGDGSVNAAAQVAMEAGLPLLVFPGGTFNHFAADLGVAGPADAVRALASGSAIRADVGTITDGDTGSERLFVNTASLGSYPHFVAARERW